MMKSPIVFSKQCQPKKHIIVSLVVFLYICATIYVASDWAYAICYSNKKGNESSSFVYNLYCASMVGLGIITGTADSIAVCDDV